MVTWTLAKKDFRVLLRDARAMVILLAMPVIFILVLGISVGEGFGKKASERVRVSVLDQDRGLESPELFPHKPWAQVVLRDLAETADISVEVIDSLPRAEELVKNGERPAVLVLGPNFSKQVALSSFMSEGINPFFRDGVALDKLDVRVLKDPTQPQASAIIEQVAQGSMLRVVLPWMIGRAFARIGDPAFIDLLSKEDVKVPTPLGKVPLKIILNTMKLAEKQELGQGLQNALQKLFPNYDLTAKTWASLTRSRPTGREGAAAIGYQEDGTGWLKAGAFRYKLLVPSFLVMFAFFLVLTMGWMFVAERRQGTMKRLCAAPLSRTQILAGKLLPCFALSLFQGFFLLGAGKLVFGMDWGSQPLWLIPVVVTTSLAAMGLALLVASVAQTETQVAIYGTLLVMVLAGMSGALMGERALMSEQLQTLTRFTPHAWALDAYRQLLVNTEAPNLEIVIQSCVVLAGFGIGFLVLAWWFLKLEGE
jgi:linearmycin/streptolysin S transport system permease protein